MGFPMVTSPLLNNSPHCLENSSLLTRSSLVLYDLFNVRQREGESLKDYLSRLWALMVRLQTQDKVVMVTAFKQGIAVGPFSDSLIRNPTETFSEVRQQVVPHINAEEVVATKRGSSFSRQPKPKGSSQARPLRVNETSAEKRMESRYVPYPIRRKVPKAMARGELSCRPKFRVSCKELLGVPRVVEKLKFPQKTDKNVGP